MQLSTGLTAALVAGALAAPPAHAPAALPLRRDNATTCKCYADDPCWPTDARWQALNQAVQGRLSRYVPPAAACFASYHNASTANADACQAIQANWTNPSWMYVPVRVCRPCTPAPPRAPLTLSPAPQRRAGRPALLRLLEHRRLRARRGRLRQRQRLRAGPLAADGRCRQQPVRRPGQRQLCPHPEPAPRHPQHRPRLRRPLRRLRVADPQHPPPRQHPVHQGLLRRRQLHRRRRQAGRRRCVPRSVPGGRRRGRRCRGRGQRGEPQPPPRILPSLPLFLPVFSHCRRSAWPAAISKAVATAR